MRISLMVILLFALAFSGCAWKKSPLSRRRAAAAGPRRQRPRESTTNQTLIVTPENTLVGKVALVNTTGRFVVLNFPLGKMAAVGPALEPLSPGPEGRRGQSHRPAAGG